MGRLKRLELENFKSYLGHQIIGPFDDFTCIIGPNGAGKSNMMDAISFVLGVQSKHLRSSRLKDLIYRQDINSPPARRAVVKLIYELSKEELTQFPDVLNELVFSRTISSTGVSTYRLNEKEVTFEAYEIVLQKIGVLVKARNFLVFQGDVESVASKSPMELTLLIEQISGSDQYQKEYEELKRQKEEIEETTIFSMQKKKMYETQRKEVKTQKNEAEYFQNQKEELEKLKTELTLWKILRITSDLESSQSLKSEIMGEISEIEEEEQAIDEELKDGKASIARLNKQLVNNDKQFAEKDKRLTSSGPQLNVSKERARKLEKKLTEQEKVKVNISRDKLAQEETLSGLREDIAELKQAEAEIDQQLSQESASLHLSERDLQEYSTLREEASSRTAKERAECLLLEKEIAGMQRRVEEIQAQETFSRDEKVNFENMLKEYIDRLEKLHESINSQAEEKNNLRKEKEELLAISESCKKRDLELQERYDAISAKLQDAGDARRATKQEEKMNEAIRTMKSLYPGVHGKLADLCRPIQKKYAIAVSTAGGKHMDAIVVDTKHVAAECIRYLKEHRIGTCSFLPLDNITPKDIPEWLRSLANTERFRVCLDLIDMDSDVYRPAVLYAVGSAVVCDTLDEAREICFTRESTKGMKLKVVTLGGHVISKNGTMTGGAVAREGSNRWEEKELEKWRKEKIELEEAINENKRNTPSRQQLIDIETKLKTIQIRINLCSADCQVCEEKRDQFHQQQRLRDTTLAELQQEKESIHKAMSERKIHQEQLENIIKSIEATVFGQFSNRIGVENIREYEETRVKKHKDLIKRKNNFAEQRSTLEAQLEYEMKKDFDNALQTCEKQISSIKSEIESLKKEINDMTKETDKLTKECDALNATRDELRRQKKDKDAELRERQLKRNDIASRKEISMKKASAQDILIERLRLQLRDVLKKAQVDEIALPAIVHEMQSAEESESNDLSWRGSITSLRSEESSLRGRHQEGDILEPSNYQSEDFLKTVDLSSVKSVHGSARKEFQLEKESNLNNEIRALVEELEGMQPNMHAVERYDGVVEKLKECSTDLDNVRDAAKDITLRFEHIRETRKSLFEKCFSHVSESLAVIYRDLTKSSKHPTGGNAYLNLDNTEEPYAGGIRYTAMPPSKRFRDMDQLSGGEKTVAALALLFSIHSYRQAPFFVLDEVDAALDNVNVQKVCNYIRKRSKNFQCVVISLKDMFFEHADILVGVCKDIQSVSSRVLTLNLQDYPVNAPTERSSTSSQLTESLTRELGTNESDTKSVDSSDILIPSPVKSSNSTSTTDSPVKGKKRERGGAQGKSGKKRSVASSGTKISEEVIPEEESEEVE